LRSPEPLLLGSSILLSFRLPRVGEIEIAGEVAYQLVPDIGVIFETTSPTEREAISSFVTNQLAA
jgi:hypothetical protein